MYCTNCGAEVEEGTSFCDQCGQPLFDDAPSADVAETPAGGAPAEGVPTEDATSRQVTAPLPTESFSHLKVDDTAPIPIMSQPVAFRAPEGAPTAAAPVASAPQNDAGKGKSKVIIIVIVAVLALVAAGLVAFFVLSGNSSTQSQGQEDSSAQAESSESEDQATTHTVVFETGGGTEYEQLEVEPGDVITTPKEPTKTDCTFEGWYADSSYTTSFTFPHTVSDTDADVIFVYAKWSDKSSTDSSSQSNASSSSDYKTVYANCIFPQSSNEYLSAEDVRHLSAESTQRAINEIYARNGYIFQTVASEKEYFEAQPWYKGTETDQSVVKSRFNEYETANMKLLEERRSQAS